jgi:hypothetical protein
MATKEDSVRCPGCGARYADRRLCCPACGDANPRLAGRATRRAPVVFLAAAAACACLAVAAYLLLG